MNGTQNWVCHTPFFIGSFCHYLDRHLWWPFSLRALKYLWKIKQKEFVMTPASFQGAISPATNAQMEKTTHVETKNYALAQYSTDKNLRPRQAVNSQPKEYETDIFIEAYVSMDNAGFLDAEGKTFEGGAGNGLFYKLNKDLAAKLASKGEVYVTDLSEGSEGSEGMVEALKKIEVLKRDGIHISKADITDLSAYAEDTFVRSILIYMLYELKTPEMIAQGLSELVRTLKSEGQAFFATMDETLHMKSLYDLLAEAKEQLAQAGIEIKATFPQAAPAILPFCKGNAESQLRNYFMKVTLEERKNALLIYQKPRNTDLEGPDLIVNYLKSLEFVQILIDNGELPELFFDKIRDLVQQKITDEGVFRITRNDLFYYCKEPIKQRANLAEAMLKV
jgi:hypothetical protein